MKIDITKPEITVTIDTNFLNEFELQSEVSKFEHGKRVAEYAFYGTTLIVEIEDFETLKSVQQNAYTWFEKRHSCWGTYYTLQIMPAGAYAPMGNLMSIYTLIKLYKNKIESEMKTVKEIAKEKANQRVQNEIKFASFANSDLFTLIKTNFELKPNRSDTAMFGVYKENRNVKCVFINYQNVIDNFDTFDVSVTYTKHPTPESKIEHRFKVVFRPESVPTEDFNFIIPTFFKHLIDNNVIDAKAAAKLQECLF